MMMFGIFAFGLLLLLLLIVLPVVLIIMALTGGVGFLNGSRRMNTQPQSVQPIRVISPQSDVVDSSAHLCSHCGAGLQPGWNHCPQCGAPIP